MTLVAPADAEIQLELFEADNATAVTQGLIPQPVVIPVIAGSIEATFSIDAAQPDRIRFAVPLQCPEWKLIDDERCVRVKVGNAYVGAFRCRIADKVFIPEPEEAARVVFDGVDLLTAFDDAALTLKPGTESFSGPIDKRLFGWQDRDYDHTEWVFPARGDEMYGENSAIERPEAWFSPFTRWYGFPFGEGAGAGATIVARRNIHLDDPKIVVVRYSAKGGARCWWDAVPAGETPMPPHADAREKTYRIIAALDAGPHTLAIEVIGPPDAPPEWAVECYAVDDVQTGRCNAHTLLFQTDDTDPWKVAWVAGGDRPGLTAGGIGRDAITEANARGVLNHPIVPDFTKEQDSNGNDWPVMRQEFVADVGRKLPELFGQLAASEWDAWSDAEGLVMHATRWRERGNFWTNPTDAPKFTGAAYAVDPNRNPNLLTYRWRQYLAPASVTILYRHKDGYAATGSGPERFFPFDDITAESAAELAEAMLTARDELLHQVTFTTWSTNGDDRIGEDVWLGDAVALPVGDPGEETWQNMRLVSATLRDSTEYPGRAIWVLEASSSAMEFRSHTEQKIARLRAGNLGTPAITAPETLGTPIKGGEATSREMVFNSQGRLLTEVDSMSDTYPFPRERRRLYRVASRLTAAGAEDTALWLHLNDDGRFQWIELPAGAEVKEDWIGDHEGRWPDYLRVEIDPPGEGAKGLTMTFYHTEPL